MLSIRRKDRLVFSKACNNKPGGSSPPPHQLGIREQAAGAPAQGKARRERGRKGFARWGNNSTSGYSSVLSDILTSPKGGKRWKRLSILLAFPFSPPFDTNHLSSRSGANFCFSLSPVSVFVWAFGEGGWLWGRQAKGAEAVFSSRAGEMSAVLPQPVRERREKKKKNPEEGRRKTPKQQTELRLNEGEKIMDRQRWGSSTLELIRKRKRKKVRCSNTKNSIFFFP